MIEVILPRHRRLSRKFAKWLANKGCDGIKVERDQIDVSFRNKGVTYMVEIKIIYKVSTKHAIREAIGQVLEYNYYEKRKPADNWIILIDSEPTDDNIRYLKRSRKCTVCHLTYVGQRVVISFSCRNSDRERILRWLMIIEFILPSPKSCMIFSYSIGFLSFRCMTILYITHETLNN